MRRLVIGVVVVGVLTSVRADAQPDGTTSHDERNEATAASTPVQSRFACYTVSTKLRPEPRTYCDEDCPAGIQSQKDTYRDLLTSITECTPATGSVYCLHHGNPQEICFPDAASCLEGDPRTTASRYEKTPVVDHCFEIKPDGTALTPEERVAAAAAAAAPSAASTETTFDPTSFPDPPRHDVLAYGGLLIAGDEMSSESGGVVGLERRVLIERNLLAHGFDANVHYISGTHGFGGYVALRGGAGLDWETGSFGLTVGLGYGGVERSAFEIPFEAFLNGNVAGLGVLIRYEQVHRFADAMGTNAKTGFFNASGFALWMAYGGALDPRVAVGFRVQERDGTDSAFLSLAVGLPGPSVF